MNFSGIRREYRKMYLSEEEIDRDPFRQFHLWFRQASDAGIEDVSAMSLSTINFSGFPSSRMVLLKDFDEKGFTFFTNYDSSKGKELKMNNRAALLFYWKELERQVRVTGIAKKIPRKDSVAYFSSRPIESRISAVISPQSLVIPDRMWLDNRWNEVQEKFRRADPVIPDGWGGFLVKPVEFEFFQGREHRLHDRIRYRQFKGKWILERLAP